MNVIQVKKPRHTDQSDCQPKSTTLDLPHPQTHRGTLARGTAAFHRLSLRLQSPGPALHRDPQFHSSTLHDTSTGTAVVPTFACSMEFHLFITARAQASAAHPGSRPQLLTGDSAPSSQSHFLIPTRPRLSLCLPISHAFLVSLQSPRSAVCPHLRPQTQQFLTSLCHLSSLI